MNSAIVAYGGRSLAYRGARAILSRRYGVKAYRAANVIRRVWKYRKPLMRAARGVYRASKRRKTPMERRLVHSPQVKTRSTGDPHATFATSHNPQTLHFKVLPYPRDADIDPNSGIGSNGIRISQDIYLRGFKICRMFWFDKSFATNGPYMVHWALVQAKDNDTKTTEIEGSLRRQFFRVHNNFDEKALNFDDNSATWNQIYNCAPMNPSGDWRILTHWKRRIESRNGENQSSTKWLFKIEKYFKLRQATHFQRKSGDTDRPDDIPNHPVYEVWWHSAMTPTDHFNGHILRSVATNTCYYHNKV